MTGSLSKNLTTGSVSKQLISFAFPLLIANLLQSMYTVIDMIVVGNFADSAGLSAVAIGGQVMYLITNAGMGLTMGSQVILAQYTGAQDREGQVRTIGTTVSFVGLLSVVITVVGLCIYTPVLRLLNTPAESFDQARQFLFVCILGVVFILGYTTVCSIMRALGDSVRPMVFVGVATGVTIVLDLILVGLFDMGALGAGIATVTAQGVAFGWSVLYLYKRRDVFVFDFKKDSFRIMGDKLKMILKIGIPFAIQFSIISLSVMFIVSMVNEYGVAASAAYGIGGRIDGFAVMPFFAIESAASTMAGQCIGAGRKDRIPKIIHFALVVNMAFAALMVALVQLFPGAFIGIFNRDPEVVRYGVMYLRIVSLTYFAFAGMTAFNAVIMGVGNSLLSLVGSVLDGVVFRLALSSLFVFVFHMGMTGILLGTTISPFGVTLIGAIYFYSGMWKRRNLVLHEGQ